MTLIFGSRVHGGNGAVTNVQALLERRVMVGVGQRCFGKFGRDATRSQDRLNDGGTLSSKGSDSRLGILRSDWGLLD